MPGQLRGIEHDRNLSRTAATQQTDKLEYTSQSFGPELAQHERGLRDLTPVAFRPREGRRSKQNSIGSQNQYHSLRSNYQLSKKQQIE